jgi:uncharacterized protein with HEPN domain
MMAKRDSRVYLHDIATAIHRIARYTMKGENHFLLETMAQDAVMRQLSIIGEAASKLPKSLKDQYPNIPWKKIIGMRNVLIHDYSETDIPTVWRTVRDGLPELRSAVERMIAGTAHVENHRRKAA